MKMFFRHRTDPTQVKEVATIEGELENDLSMELGLSSLELEQENVRARIEKLTRQIEDLDDKIDYLICEREQLKLIRKGLMNHEATLRGIDTVEQVAKELAEERQESGDVQDIPRLQLKGAA